jgi:hypothetical protein
MLIGRGSNGGEETDETREDEEWSKTLIET